jgi:Uma2 family endonuclease
MTVALRQVPSLAEFLAWEERQETKHEFDGTAPVAMVGGIVTHARIQANLITTLHQRLRGKPCEVFGSELKLKMARTLRYPDAMVVCAKLPGRATFVTDPAIVFEILSASTSRTDRVLKVRECGATSAIARYVILEQTGPAATVFSRERGDWLGRVHDGLDAVVPLPEIGVDLPLADIYTGLDFDDDPAPGVDLA